MLEQNDKNWFSAYTLTTDEKDGSWSLWADSYLFLRGTNVDVFKDCVLIVSNVSITAKEKLLPLAKDQTVIDGCSGGRVDVKADVAADGCGTSQNRLVDLQSFGDPDQAPRQQLLRLATSHLPNITHNSQDRMSPAGSRSARCEGFVPVDLIPQPVGLGDARD